jgi:hypothetical protein
MNSPSRPLLAAAIALAVALFVFGSALARAITTAPASPEESYAQPPADDAVVYGEEALTMDELVDALERDPFQPDRQRPPTRYRLPGDVDPPPPPPPPAPPPVPDFRVAGTAVSPEGGFAVMRVGDGPVRVLAVGEYLGGYQLDRVSSASATMKNEDREVTVTVPGPAFNAAAAAPTAPRAPAQRGPAQRQQQAREMTAEQAAVMTRLLESAREQGATPAMLQALQRMIQERGIDNMGTMDIQIQGSGITIRRPDNSQ